MRLDQELVTRKLVSTRSQAESYIRMGMVKVNGKSATKVSQKVYPTDSLEVTAQDQYVSRAAFKLESVANALGLSFRDKVVLDVGSSTGGFTDFALRHGANKVIAIDVGTDQLHPSLRMDSRVELHEKTDIRDVKKLSTPVQLVLIDTSFISLKEVLPAVFGLVDGSTQIVAMAKPQFETGESTLKHKGVIKNERMRRDILKDLENWMSKKFVIADKADSGVHGEKGNQERFYLLQKASA